jgi:hypothetical protein
MKYRIDLVQTVHEGCTLIVEADDQESAEKKALELVYSDGTKEPIPTWEFLDSLGDAEVVAAEEWPPHDEPPRPHIEGVEVVEFKREDPEGTVINLMDALHRTLGE